MAVTFSEPCERDVREALHVRVAVYPALRGWVGRRVYQEVSNSLDTLGITDRATDAGSYRVEEDPAEVVAAINALRGKRQRQAYLVEVIR